MEAGWIERGITFLAGSNPIWQGLTGGLVITAFNTLGALAVFIWRRPSQKMLDALLGFAAGMMIAASFTGLILPGIGYAGVVPVLIGMALGVLFLDQADRWIPHMHAVMGPEGIETRRIKAVWLFIIAITLHNMPEGLAVGVGFGSGDLPAAIKLMLAIGIQNFPEGLAVSVSALAIGKPRAFYASLVGIRSGLVEIPLALLGVWAVHAAQWILPYAMGFAAGAMLYVVSDEIVPETHAKGNERIATLGTMIGIALMLYLDATLG